MSVLWSTAKEAARAAKGLMSKNARNAVEAQAKKERGPVKAFFHITKNENVPAINEKGLLANSPNANINSAKQPFKKLGIKSGGVWVTDRPTSFPVYGTTVGGKGIDRADALTTYKIELPVGELKELPAVYNPYGRDMRLTNAAEPLVPFGTWANENVGVTALLKDVPPKNIKNIGYVEELNPKSSGKYLIQPELFTEPRETLNQTIYGERRNLSKADRAALSRVTGHDRTAARDFNREHDEAKSPARFVEDYLNRNRPIQYRLQILPESRSFTAGINQFAPKRVIELNEFVLPSNFDHYRIQLKQQPPTAQDWTVNFKPYTKPGEDATKKVIFQPGAYSRGMGTIPTENIRDEIKNRHFNWNEYIKVLSEGNSPFYAADRASPRYVLDWNNIVYSPESGYMPAKVRPEDGLSFTPNVGHISAGTPRGYLKDMVTGKTLVNPNVQGATQQFYNLGPDDIESLKFYNAYDDIVKDKDHPTWQELTRVIMRINAGTMTPYW